MNLSIGQHLAQLVFNRSIEAFESKEDLMLHSQITTRFAKQKFPGERKHRLNMATTVSVTPRNIVTGQALIVSNSSNFEVKTTHGAGHMSASKADTFSCLVQAWSDYLHTMRDEFLKNPPIFGDTVLICRTASDLELVRQFANTGGELASSIYMFLKEHSVPDILTPFLVHFRTTDGVTKVNQDLPIGWHEAQATVRDVMPLLRHALVGHDIDQDAMNFWTSRRYQQQQSNTVNK